MLSLFPQLLFLAPLGAFVIRIAAALTFGFIAYRHSHEASGLAKGAAVLEAACAALLLVGMYTQVGALLGIGIWILHAAWRPLRVLPVSSMLLLFALCLSILVTGAGAFAFDLPL